MEKVSDNKKLVTLWYLDKYYFHKFQIKNEGTHNCLDTMGRKSGEEVGLSYCHGLGGNQVNFAWKFFVAKSSNKFKFYHFQVFAYTKRQQVMSDDNCLDAASPDGPVKLVRCHGMGGNQAWVYNDEVCEFYVNSRFMVILGVDIKNYFCFRIRP